MDVSGQSALTTTGAAAAWGLGAVAFFAAVKIAWGLALRAMKNRRRLGERWGDARATVVERRDGEGFVDAGGERWRAVSGGALAPGDKVRIVRARGLTLDVGRT
jgi:membrane-bound ClpP family serine protease